MKTISLIILIGITSAAFADEQNASDETSLILPGLASAGSLALSIRSHLKLKENEDKEFKASTGRDKTFIISPDVDSDGVVFKNADFSTYHGRKNTVLKAKKFDSVTVEYVLGPLKQADYVDNAKADLIRAQEELRDLKRLHKNYGDLTNISDNKLIDAIEGKTRLENSITAQELHIHKLESEYDNIASLDQEQFMRKYKGELKKEMVLDMRTESEIKRLNSLLNGVSLNQEKIISIKGHRNPEYYQTQAKKNKIQRASFGVLGIALSGATIISGVEAYSHISDSDQTIKDDFYQSTSSIQIGSNAKKQ